LKTPFGNPHSVSVSAKISAVAEVISLGFITTEHPAASA
jgi:hypothetical protein